MLCLCNFLSPVWSVFIHFFLTGKLAGGKGEGKKKVDAEKSSEKDKKHSIKNGVVQDSSKEPGKVSAGISRPV